MHGWRGKVSRELFLRQWSNHVELLQVTIEINTEPPIADQSDTGSDTVQMAKVDDLAGHLQKIVKKYDIPAELLQ